MNRTLLGGGIAAALVIAGSVVLTTGTLNANDEVALDSEDKEIGYSMGMMFAEQIQADIQDLETDAFVQGMIDGLEGNEPKLSSEERQQRMQTYQQRMQDQQQSQQQQTQGDAAGNLEESERFLEENAEKDGIETTESGLQYEILEEGDGASPEASDSVTVHYTGELMDGSVFDSSEERGQPASFPLQQVIPGWTEGLQLMKEGGRYRFFIHPELAYGEQAPESIGPNQALIFEVELLEVE